MTQPETRFEDTQAEMRVCAYCQRMYHPKRSSQAFCGNKCRNAFHIDCGAEGRVASVRRIGRGASIVVHLSGPAAEAALQLTLGRTVRVVTKP